MGSENIRKTSSICILFRKSEDIHARRQVAKVDLTSLDTPSRARRLYEINVI